MPVEGELEVSEPLPEARLGRALRRAREGRGVSLRALARALYRSHRNIVEYERGHRLAPLDHCQRTSRIFREIKDSQGELRALSDLGSAYLALEQLNESVECELQALAICRATGNRYSEARALNHLGMAYRAQRRLEEALDCLQQALAIRQELGYTWGQEIVFVNLGKVYCDLRRFDEAIECCQQSLAICLNVGTVGVRGVR